MCFLLTHDAGSEKVFSANEPPQPARQIDGGGLGVGGSAVPATPPWLPSVLLSPCSVCRGAGGWGWQWAPQAVVAPAPSLCGVGMGTETSALVPHPGGNFLGITNYSIFTWDGTRWGALRLGRWHSTAAPSSPFWRVPGRASPPNALPARAGKPHGVKFPEIPSAGVSAPITAVTSRYPADGR